MIGSNPPTPTLLWYCERSRDRVWTVSHNKNRNTRAFPMCLISYYRKTASITSLGPFPVPGMDGVLRYYIFWFENELLAVKELNQKLWDSRTSRKRSVKYNRKWKDALKYRKRFWPKFLPGGLSWISRHACLGLKQTCVIRDSF